jgi:hypothetical protein
MSFARRVFNVAGIYGLAVILPQYFLEAKLGRDYAPAITHPEYFYGFLGVAGAWQVAFLMIARDPVRFRPMMIPSMLEKVSFGAAAIALYATGRLSALTLTFGVLDLVWLALFVLAYRRTPAA